MQTFDDIIKAKKCQIPRNNPVEIRMDADMRRLYEIYINETTTHREAAKAEHELEDRLLRDVKCGDMEDVRSKFFSIDDKKLDDLLSGSSSLNRSLQANISCMMEVILSNPRTIQKLQPLVNEKFRDWLQQAVLIGKPSAEGFAMKISPSKDTNLFVFKTPRRPSDTGLIHEAFIGMYGLNNLRRMLPNYMYVYGYTKCSPPVFDNKTPITWCSTSTPAITYLILENIRNAIPIGEFCNEVSSERDFLNVFMQLLNALNLANKKYGYTHYDLHDRNVMVRTFEKEIAIPFLNMDLTVVGYIKTKYVPYLIDYGQSYIKIDGYGFGYYDNRASFPMYDVYKHICFLGQNCNKPNIFRLLTKMYTFFDKNETLDSRVRRRLADLDDYFECDRSWMEVTHDEFIDWMLDNFQTNIEPERSLNVIPAPFDTSLDTCKFYSMITSNKGPGDALQYCDAILALKADRSLSDLTKDRAKLWLNNRFDAEKNFMETFNTTMEITASIPETPVMRVDRSRFTDPTYMAAYKNSLLDLMKIKEEIFKSLYYSRSITCALESQMKSRNHRAELNNLTDVIKEKHRWYHDQKKIAQNDLEITKSFSSRDEKVVEFWHDEIPYIISAF